MRAPPETLRYENGPGGEGVVVLVAGVPGAGKSSLLRRLAVQTPAPAIREDAVARADALGVPENGLGVREGALGAPEGARGVREGALGAREDGQGQRDGSGVAPRIVDSDQVRALLPRPLTGGPGYLLTRGPVYLLHWIRIALAMAAPADVPVFVHDPATRAWTRHLVALLARLNRRRAHLLWVVAEPEQARAGQRLRGRRLPTTTQLRHEQRQRRIRAGVAAGTVRFPGFASARFITRAEAASLHIVFPTSARDTASGRTPSTDVEVPSVQAEPAAAAGQRDNTGPQPVTTSGPAA